MFNLFRWFFVMSTIILETVDRVYDLVEEACQIFRDLADKLLTIIFLLRHIRRIPLFSHLVNILLYLSGQHHLLTFHLLLFYSQLSPLISIQCLVIIISMKEQRKPYKYQNRVVYEWDESLDSVFCFIELPPLPAHIKPATLLKVDISSHAVSVGFKDTPPYLSHKLKGIADSQESYWYIQQKKDQNGKDSGLKQLVLEIQKAQKGVRWGALFQGHQKLNPLQQQQLKKKLLLQRFQQENPGFDFSGAEFNGQVPQARTFMGGPKTT